MLHLPLRKEALAGRSLLSGPVWRGAWDALLGLGSEPPAGTIDLGSPGFYLNVHSYTTRPLEACRFESHRATVDIQVVLQGAEWIDWHPADELTPEGAWDAERDFQFHQPPAVPPLGRLRLVPGFAAIFFPEDGHRPQIADGDPAPLLKAVVKIPHALLTTHPDPSS
ncbi:MAG: YhcH/YjgK/YiaL family protein [Opitutales bacterium]